MKPTNNLKREDKLMDPDTENAPSQEPTLQLDQLCDQFEDELLEGSNPSVEAYVGNAPDSERDRLLYQLLKIEVEYQMRAGDFCRDELLQRFESDREIADQVIQEIADRQEAEDIDEYIGPYRLLERLGEGGMGVVYVAEQRDPIRRMVALKIIKPGMESGEILRRFEAERQALAMMDHPNIAKVLDAGTTDSSRPYFVMELVRGKSITEYCDQDGLSSERRLSLFQDVCSAIQHAHQKGIIHRDIKPGNVLITVQNEEPVVKVIDFGVAKAVHGPLINATVYTRASQWIGTPLYMSPEQAEFGGTDIDTRSDIYSLGVLLYELLSGTTPFDQDVLKQASFDEMRRIIREVDPPSPSTRVSSMGEAATQISQHRGAEPRQLQQQLAGDLDWVVMKAMEKNRSRRYQTASEFSHDIQRFLNQLPVFARPQTAWYQFSKFVSRNRRAVGVSAAVLLLLVAGIAGTLLGLFRSIDANKKLNLALDEARQLRAVAEENAATAKRESMRAIEQAEIAQAVNDFLNRDLLSAAAPSVQVGKGREVKLSEVLLAAENRIQADAATDGRFSDKPLTRAAIHETLGNTLSALGEFERAGVQLLEAKRLYEEVRGPSSESVLNIRRLIGVLYRQKSELPTAEQLLRETLQDCRKELGDNHRLTVLAGRDLGKCLLDFGRHEDAAILYDEIRQKLPQFFEKGHPELLLANMEQARIVTARGELELAEEMLQQAKTEAEGFRGENTMELSFVLNELGGVQRRMKRFEEAENSRRLALEGYREVYGNEHPFTLAIISNLGVSIHMSGRHEEATPFLRESMEGRVKVLGEANSDALFSTGYLAFNLACLKQSEEAKALIDRAIEVAQAELAPDDWNIGDVLSMQGRVLHMLEEWQKADEALEAAYEHLERVLGVDHAYTYNCIINAMQMLDSWDEQPDHPDLSERREEWSNRLSEFRR